MSIIHMMLWWSYGIMMIIIWWYNHHLVLWWSSYDHMKGEMPEDVQPDLFTQSSLDGLLSPNCQGWHRRWAGRQAFHHQAPLHLWARGKLACSPTSVAGPEPWCKSSSWQCCTPPLFWRQALSLSPSYSAHVALVDIFLLILEPLICCTVLRGGCNSNYKPVWEDLCIFSSAVSPPPSCTLAQPGGGVYGRLQGEADAEPGGIWRPSCKRGREESSSLRESTAPRRWQNSPGSTFGPSQLSRSTPP